MFDQISLEKYWGISNHTVDLDVLAKSLDIVLIVLGNDDKIQMCSVESYGKDTPYGNILDNYTRSSRGYISRGSDIFATLLSCIEMFGWSQCHIAICHYLLMTYLVSHSYLFYIVFVKVVWMIFYSYSLSSVIMNCHEDKTILL